MDIGTLAGCILGSLLLLFAILIDGQESIAPFWNSSALLIVFGGAASTLLMAFPFKQIRRSFSAIWKCFHTQKTESNNIMNQIVFLAGSARREGLLAQERRIPDIANPFLAEAVQLIVDGLQPAMVESILNREAEGTQHRHQQTRNILLYSGRCIPAFGMIGTLIGLVLMLTRLQAETVGPGMAVAVLTTLYAVAAVNLFFYPITEKLRQLHESEMHCKAMIICGVLAIQAGEHPRMIQLKLQTYLLPEERLAEGERVTAIDLQITPQKPLSLPNQEDADNTNQTEATKQAA